MLDWLKLGVILIVLVALVVLGINLKSCVGGGFGASGGGDGYGSKEIHPGLKTHAKTVPEGSHFVITVEEDAIIVNGKTVKAADVVALAERDGRKIMVVWKRARTGAESELIQVLTDANLAFTDRSVDQ